MKNAENAENRVLKIGTAENALNADTDSSGDISFDEFASAIGSANLDFA